MSANLTNDSQWLVDASKCYNDGLYFEVFRINGDKFVFYRMLEFILFCKSVSERLLNGRKVEF